MAIFSAAWGFSVMMRVWSFFWFDGAFRVLRERGFLFFFGSRSEAGVGRPGDSTVVRSWTLGFARTGFSTVCFGAVGLYCSGVIFSWNLEGIYVYSFL